MTTPQHWYGEMKPKIYHRKATYAVEKSMEIGRRGIYYSTLCARLIEPAPDYPDVRIHFGLVNGNRASFTQIKPEELGVIIQTLQAWQQIFMDSLPPLEQKSAVYREERAKYEASIANMTNFQELLKKMGGNENEI